MSLLLHQHECAICENLYDCSISNCSIEDGEGVCNDCAAEYEDEAEDHGEMDEYYPGDSDEVDPKEF